MPNSTAGGLPLRFLHVSQSLLIATVAAVPTPSAAHDQSYGFLWASQPTTTSYSPDPAWTYNDGGGATIVTRTDVGRYTVRWAGLNEVSNELGNAHVTAYGGSSEVCKVASFTREEVRVACFDAAGLPTDTRFTALLLRPEFHPSELAVATAGEPTNASYTPNGAYNAGTSGPVTATRTAAGLYRMTWSGFGAVGTGGGHAQVTAVGADNARCAVVGWSAEAVDVRCVDPTGAPTDSVYNVAYFRPDEDADGIAFSWADQANSPVPYTPPASYSFNPTGGATTVTPISPGRYAVSWSGLGAVGINEGHFQVSAYGATGNHCKVESWSGDGAFVRCFDPSGAPVNQRFALVYLVPTKSFMTQSYAFVTGNMPSFPDPYTPATPDWYNAYGGTVEIRRLSIGRYDVWFSGMEHFGLNGGNVQVSSAESDASYCKVVGWITNHATVQCFASTGIAADAQFRLLFMKPEVGTDGVAYAWASQALTASYAADPQFAYNPTGGAVTLTRLAVGRYAVAFAGLDGVGGNAGQPQVTAYGTGNERCELEGWTGSLVIVRCFDPAGSATDTRFSLLFIKPDPSDDGFAYAWADLATNSSYSPLDAFSLNPSGGSILATRATFGEYTMTWSGFENHGINAPFTYGFPLVSATTTTGAHCGAPYTSFKSASVYCHDPAGLQADVSYAVLFLKPVSVPEPATASGLLTGLVWLGMRHLHRCRRGRD